MAGRIEAVSCPTANHDLKNVIANTYELDETGWYMAKQKTYSHLLNRQSDYTDDVVFGNFIHACNNSSIGQLYKAGLYIGSNMADSAEMINNSIVTTNIADSLHVFVNRYCIKYIRNGSVAVSEAVNLRLLL